MIDKICVLYNILTYWVNSIGQDRDFDNYKVFFQRAELKNRTIFCRTNFQTVVIKVYFKDAEAT